MKTGTENLTRQQASVWIPRNERGNIFGSEKGARYLTHATTSMFLEDVRLGLIPYAKRGDPETSIVSLIRPNDEVEEIVTAAFRQQYHYHRALTESVRDFMQSCCNEILIEGSATFEVVFLRDSQDRARRFLFFPVDTLSIRHLPEGTFQVLPEQFAQERGLPMRILLPKERLISFRAPRHFREALADLLDILAMSDAMIPEFGMPRPDRQQQVPFDLSFHEKTRRRVIGSVTRQFGWSARRLLSDWMTEYADLHRFLTFQSFLIQMRNELFTSLNQGLRIAGRQLNLECQVELNGLLNEADVQSARKHLEAGDMPFLQVIEPFLAS